MRILTLVLTLIAGTAAASPEFWRHEWPNTNFNNTSVENWVEILSGGPPRDGIPAINDPTFVKGTAVVDTDNHRATVIKVRYTCIAGDPQGFVRGGHGVHVKGFAVGGLVAMKFLAVPARRTPGDITVVAVEHVVLLAPDLVGRFIARPPGGLVNRNRIVKTGHIEVTRRGPVSCQGIAGRMVRFRGRRAAAEYQRHNHRQQEGK